MITIENVIAKLTKKHPLNYGISASESNHCVLGHAIYGFVETENEKIMYGTDKAGRLRVCSIEKLTPTYISIRQEPHDSVVVIRGGKYNGHYVVSSGYEGWLETSTNISDAKPMRTSYAREHRDYVAHHSQHCFRGIFEVVTV